MTAPTEPSKTIKAVELTVRILETLQEFKGAGVTEVAEAVGTSKATAHNHLRTLENEKLVVRDEDGQYDIGLRVLDIAHYAKSRFPISDIVKEEVDKLADESGEMALFTVEEHWKCITLYVAAGKKAVQTPVYVGNREELHNTAVGKAILAHKAPEEVERYLDEYGLKEVTEDTITDREEFLAELEEVRERGVAYNREEAIHGLVGIGLPVRRHDGTVVGALSIIGPESRMDEESLQGEYVDMIKRSANIIEINSTSL
jgi:DNA-binding IclR family transcriptional regulator